MEVTAPIRITVPLVKDLNAIQGRIEMHSMAARGCKGPVDLTDERNYKI
jgi:hypothetical protein